MKCSLLKNHIYLILIVVLFFIALLNIFYGLNNFPFFSWDEARHGVSAFEMLKNNNYILNTYRNKIDYWNLKPPLSFWAVMAGYKIAGFNALGLRLFSGISALLTILIVTLFVHKIYGKLASLISMLTLTTCTQFLINHSARTGEADSLFVFFFTSAILSLLLVNRNIKWLYIFGLSFSFAFLTKSWHAGNILAIMILYFIFTGMYKKLVFKHWFLLSLFMVAPIFIWGAIRFQYDGIEFFKQMVTYDLLQRSSTPIEGHLREWNYYLKILWLFFKFWIILLFGLMTIYSKRNLSSKWENFKPNHYLIGIIIWIIVPILLFSLAETKIRWYILPVYPALSILISTLVVKILQEGKLAVRLIVLLSIVFVTLNYEIQIQTYIHHPIPKYHLALLQSIQGNKEFKGYHLFRLQNSKQTNWPQNTVLAAELYDDLKVEDGNLHDFLRTSRSLLLIEKGEEGNQFIKSNQLMIISYNKWGYLVTK